MKIRILLLVALLAPSVASMAQDGIAVINLINKGRYGSEKESLVIRQDPDIDTLVNRHILANLKKQGIDGYRIQIYRGGHRTAGEEAKKIQMRFMESFPGIKADLIFDKPNWFKVKVGEFRTREEAAGIFFRIQAKYPDAYLVKEIIGFQSSKK